jgi:hypothetical protein
MKIKSQHIPRLRGKVSRGTRCDACERTCRAAVCRYCGSPNGVEEYGLFAAGVGERLADAINDGSDDLTADCRRIITGEIVAVSGEVSDAHRIWLAGLAAGIMAALE